MEIIRRATLEEVLALENITETASNITTGLLISIASAIIFALAFGMIFRSEAVFFSVATITLIGIFGGLYYTRAHLAPREQALYNDSNYYVAVITDAETFEHDDYTLIDHHDGNAYFVEKVNEN